MGIGLRDRNLIFLISQPRAGSTLLQRMLGSHPDVHTVSEPWLMLHPLYALRAKGHQAEYNAYLARSALRGFLQQLPGREDDYIEGVRRMYTYLYEQALAGSAKRYFLDKTPRYYFIIPELYRTFPQAQYIVLLRNPLAVLSSIVNRWARETYFALRGVRDDLLRAPHLLVEGLELLGEAAILVHYEDLVRKPETGIRRICEALDIPYTPEMVEYGSRELSLWAFGDRRASHMDRPVADSLDKWVSALRDRQVWRLCHDYLHLLGGEVLGKLGYDLEPLAKVLADRHPGKLALGATVPLAWFVGDGHKSFGAIGGGMRWLVGALLRQGTRNTVRSFASRLKGILQRPCRQRDC